MAVDSFMVFQTYDASNNYLEAESQVDFTKVTDQTDAIGSPFFTANKGLGEGKSNVFEVDTFSFDIEQTINMSSQSSGAGAGKVQFNPFKVTRKIDKSSSTFFRYACQGKTFKTVNLGFRKAAGEEASGLFFLRFDFGFVAVKTISWSHGDDSPTEDLEFEYGALNITYGLQKQDGTITPQNKVGWDKIKNIDISAKS